MKWKGKTERKNEMKEKKKEIECKQACIVAYCIQITFFL